MDGTSETEGDDVLLFTEGLKVGASVGPTDSVGWGEILKNGADVDGAVVGLTDEILIPEGKTVGVMLGASDKLWEGEGEGSKVGARVGIVVGNSVGITVGDGEGDSEGATVELEEGTSDGV